jgi:hypothetical protein
MSDESNQDRDREKLLAEMRARFEQAQRSGKSTAQIHDEIRELARQQGQARAPQLAAGLRSWLRGLRNLVIVGALALGLAVTLALLVEHRYAAPLCETYGAQHGLTYTALEYPTLGRGGSAASNTSGDCIFRDAAGAKRTLSLGKLAPNFLTDLLMSAGLEIELTFPVSFVLIGLIAASLFRRAAA